MTSPSVPATAGHADDVTWRRLSNRMLLVHPVQELIRALPALAGLLIAGTSGGQGPLWSLAGVAVVTGLGLLRWFTTTYRIGPERVELRRGLLRRRVLSVPRDRIRTVDVTAHAMHRLLGLAKVTVGTGRSDRKDDSGIKLDGLSAAAAASLREELLHWRGARPAAAGTPGAAGAPDLAKAAEVETELARFRPEWVRYAPFTLSGLVTIGILAGFSGHLLSQAHLHPGRFGPLRDAADRVREAPLPVAIAQVVVGLAVAIAVLSTIGYLLAFANFRLTRHSGGTLHVSRGLITTRATSIEERRLRGVELNEPLLLRLVRGGRCQAITTGLRVGRGSGGTLLLPPAARTEAERVAVAVLGTAEPLACPLTPHGPAARQRRYTRALAGAALLVAAVLALAWLVGLPAWVWVGSFAAPPVAALLAADRYRALGHAMVGGRLVSRRGSIVRRRSVLACDGIIGWNLRRSFFQRRAGLATLTATTAAGAQRYDVPDVPDGEALRLADAALPGLLTPFLADIPQS
ncbi:MAG: PH domain-containing protein [Mycobacteriales bacterium]